MISCPALFDDRVSLEPLGREHVGALTRAATEDRSTFALAPVPGDAAAMLAYVEAALEEQGAGRGVPFAIRRRSTDAVVGSIRFLNLEWWSWPPGPVLVDGDPRTKSAGDPPDVVEIGSAWLAREAQRTEVMTATTSLMMQHAFEVWRVHRLVLKTDARNERSRAAILRLGATFEGILRSHLPAADGVVRDTAMFSVLRAEWPALRARSGAAHAARRDPEGRE